MNRLLLAGVASATAIAFTTPAHAHPSWHYEGGCGIAVVSDGTDSPQTQWEGELSIVATATDAVTGVPALVPIAVECVLRINGGPGWVVLWASGTTAVAELGTVTFNADPDDVVELCDYVTVDSDFHLDCHGITQVTVPEPVRDVVDQLRVCDDGWDNDGDGYADWEDPGCVDRADPDERGTTACDDGLDNDLDGATDSGDPGCSGPHDTEEGDAGGSLVGCDDGLDNDADGVADSADPGCADRADPDERGTTACDDGADNDGDVRADYPADPGCTGPADTDETGPPACADGIDNDGDLAADMSDSGCSGPSDTNERGTEACDDGADNDGDGATDYPQDSGCGDPGDGSERSAAFPCDDGVDNDGDGVTDYGSDPGCRDPRDPNETTIP